MIVFLRSYIKLELCFELSGCQELGFVTLARCLSVMRLLIIIMSSCVSQPKTFLKLENCLSAMGLLSVLVSRIPDVDLLMTFHWHDIG